MRFLLAMLFCVISTICLAEEMALPEGVSIKTYVRHEGDIFVSQLVRVNVDITLPTWFTEAPRFPDLKVDGAIALMPSLMGVNLTDEKNGKTQTVHTQTYTVIPQRAGDVTVPPIKVTLGISIDGKPSEPFTLVSEPVVFRAVTPPDMPKGAAFVAVPELEAKETYNTDFAGLKAGDAVKRTIQITASDTFGLAIPAVKFEQIEGLSSYPAQPKLSNKTNRGEYSGSRTDQMTYVIGEKGNFKLPEISLHWFDTSKGVVETVVFPSVEFSAAANPSFQQSGSGQGSINFKGAVSRILAFLKNNIQEIALSLAAMYLIWLAAKRFGPEVYEKGQAYRKKLQNSEKRYFKTFRKACRNGDPSAMVGTFWRWMDRVSPRDQTGSLGNKHTLMIDEGFQDSTRKISHELYSTERGKNKTALNEFYPLASQLRQRVVHPVQAPHEGEKQNPLNPRKPV